VSDPSRQKLLETKSKYDESKLKINKKLKNLVNFLSSEEELTEKEIEHSFIQINPSKINISPTHFNLDDLLQDQ